METQQYAKIYISIVIIFLIIIGGTFYIGSYIEKDQENRFGSLEKIPTEIRVYDKEKQLAQLNEKLSKLDEIAKQYPNRIAIIEEQKLVIRAHIRGIQSQ